MWPKTLRWGRVGDTHSLFWGGLAMPHVKINLSWKFNLSFRSFKFRSKLIRQLFQALFRGNPAFLFQLKIGDKPGDKFLVPLINFFWRLFVIVQFFFKSHLGTKKWDNLQKQHIIMANMSKPGKIVSKHSNMNNYFKMHLRTLKNKHINAIVP